MANLERQLKEDRALRDAARRLIETDLGLVKGDVKDRSLGKRATDFVGSESRQVAQVALGFAAQRPVLVSGIVLAILAFLFRNSIIDLVIDWLDDDDEADGVDPAHEPHAGEYSGSEPEIAEARSHDNKISRQTEAMR